MMLRLVRLSEMILIDPRDEHRRLICFFFVSCRM